MKILEHTTDSLQHTFSVSLDAKQFQERVELAILEHGAGAQLKGFRPGKVPLPLLKQNFGSRARSDVLEKMTGECIDKIIADHNLKPILRPHAEITPFSDGQDITIQIQIEVMPNVPLPAIADYSFDRMVATIGESEIKDGLEKLRDINTAPTPFAEKEVVQEGDLLKVEMKIFHEGKLVEDLSKKDGMPIIVGRGILSKAFDKDLIGKKPGDSGSTEVTIDHVAFNEFTGKTVSIQYKIQLAMRSRIPDDERLMEAFNLSTKKELLDLGKQYIEKSYTDISDDILKSSLFEKLSDQYNFEIPKGMVEMETQSMWREFEESELIQNRKVSDWPAEKIQKEMDAFRTSAEKRVKLGLLLAEFGTKNGVSVSREEITEAVVQEARKYPGEEKQVFNYYKSNPQALSALQAPIFEKKVIELAFRTMKVTEKQVSSQELMAAYDALEEDLDGTSNNLQKEDKSAKRSSKKASQS